MVGACCRLKTHCRLTTNNGRLISWLIFLYIIGASTNAYSLDLESVVQGLQKRYASVDTVTANFRQEYRAPGIRQSESGQLWLKRPGLMRWEYRHPEEKLFVTDGKEAFFYVPQERQVTVQPFTAADMRRTPLEFLLGGRDIETGFDTFWASEFRAEVEGTVMIRLIPREDQTEYSFLVLEIDKETYDIQRIIIHELSGNTSDFLFTDQIHNVRLGKKRFEFDIPDGVEVLRLENSE